MTATNILISLLVNSAVFAVLFGLMLIVRKLMAKRISAAFQYMLWAAVVIKLIVPFGFESALSPYGLLAAANNASPPATLSSGTAAGAQPVGNAINNNAVLPETGPAEDTAAADTGTAELQNASESTETKTIETDKPVDWTAAALGVWAAGMLAAGTLIALDARKLRRGVRRENTAPSARVIRVFEQCKRELGVRRHIDVITQPAVNVPLVMGAFRPVLVLPEDIDAADEAQIRHVCLHELAHIKYGDLAVICILNALCSLYWFNPLVWLCFRFIRKDMETACDARVLHRLGSTARQGYICTVLQFAAREEKWRTYAGSPKRRAAFCSEKAAMGMADGRLPMEQRVRGMFRKPRTGLSGRVIAITAAVLMLAAGILSACRPLTENPGVSNPVTVSNHPAVDLNWVPKPPESYKVSGHWNEIYQNGKPKMVIETGVYVPDVNEYPVVKMEQAAFTQQRVDELVNYFAKGKKLYLPHIMTKADYRKQLEIVKRGKLVDGVYVDSGWTLEEIKQTEEKMASAPEDSPIIYTDTTLTYRRDFETGAEITGEGKNFLSVLFDNGEGNEASISVSNFVQRQGEQDFSTHFFYSAGGSDYGISESMYQNMTSYYGTEEEAGWPGAGELFGKVSVTPEEAIAQADNVISGLGISDMILIGAEKYVTPDAPEKCGYEVQYARESGGIAGYVPESYGRNSGEEPPEYSAPFYEEMLIVRVSKDGLESLLWRNCAKAVETVNKNAELLPFESIKQALKDRIIYKTRFNGGLGRVNYTVNVTSAELRMGYIDVKGNSKQALFVPVWFFRTQETWTRGGETVLGNETVYKFNAIDGGAIEWR